MEEKLIGRKRNRYPLFRYRETTRELLMRVQRKLLSRSIVPDSPRNSDCIENCALYAIEMETDDYEELPDLDASDGSNGADKSELSI
uniref:Uncharacterized protein n=1 Tax=Caenorhabditis japonica TaxID=281687 RepID=K7HGT9_CAEJA